MKLRSVLAGGVLALALVGCGDDESDGPDAAPSSPVATSSSPTEDPSPTFDPTKETAKEFIRRWIQTSNEMQETGDTSDYREFTKNCMPCSKYADQVEGIHDAGGFIATEGEEVLSVQHDGGDEWHVEVRGHDTTYRESAAGKKKTIPGAEFRYVVLMERQNDAWQLISFQGEFD